MDLAHEMSHRFFWGKKPLWAGDLFWHIVQYRSYGGPDFTALHVWIMQGYAVRGRNKLCHRWCQRMKTTMSKHHLCVVAALGKFSSPFCPSFSKKRPLPYIYVRKGRNTTCFLSLHTHRKHFLARPGLLKKMKEGSESQTKMLTNLWSPIGLDSHSKWRVFLHIRGDHSLDKSIQIWFFWGIPHLSALWIVCTSFADVGPAWYQLKANTCS